MSHGAVGAKKESTGRPKDETRALYPTLLPAVPPKGHPVHMGLSDQANRRKQAMNGFPLPIYSAAVTLPPSNRSKMPSLSLTHSRAA